MKSSSKPYKYLVAGHQPWCKDVYRDQLSKLPGKWHYVSSPEKLLSTIQRIQPRYVFFLHWSHKVPSEVLNTFECVCFHMTDLPYGRGGSPLQNLIVRGHKDTKLSAFRMSEAFDAGPIYAKAKLSLKGSAEAIYKRCMLTAARMIKTIIRTQPVPKPQSGKVVAFKRRQPSQSLLPKNLSVEQVYDFIRMLDAEGYPHAYVEWGNLRMELQSSKLSGGKVTAQVTITQNKTL